MSTEGWCQFNANRNPQYGVQWRRKLYSMPNTSTVKTAWLEAAPGTGPSQVRALLCSLMVCSALARPPPSFSSTGKMQSSVEKETVLSGAEGSSLLCIERRHHPWSLIRLSSCKWGLQILAVLLVQMALSWLIRMELLWLVSATKLRLDGESLNPIGYKRIPVTPL